MTHSSSISAIRMEEIFAAARAQRRSFNPRVRQACAYQLPSIPVCKIQVGLGPLRPSYNRAGIRNGGRHFFPDFVTTDTDVRANRCTQVLGMDAEFLNKSANRSLRDDGGPRVKSFRSPRRVENA